MLTWTHVAELAVAVVAFYLVFAVAYWGYWLTSSVRALKRNSRQDPLTGLGTGHWLETERWQAALRSGRPLGVVYLDLDHLKVRNDRDGHAAGDAYIKTAADEISRSCRRGVDEVFRQYTAGDEFIILLHGELAEPAKFVQSLRRRLNARGVMASFALCYTTETRFLPSRTELRIRAERGCRRAKAMGGDCGLLIPDAASAVDSAAGVLDDEDTAPIAREEAIPELIPCDQATAAIGARLQARRIAESATEPAAAAVSL